MATYYVPSESGWSGENSNYHLRLKVEQTYNAGSNQSALTVSLEAYCSSVIGTHEVLQGGTISGGGGVLYTTPGDHTALYIRFEGSGSTWKAVESSGAKSWTFMVSHNTDGSASVPFAVSLVFNMYYQGTNYQGVFNSSANLNLQNKPTYQLTISQGDATKIVVTRDGAALTNGATVYGGDELTISVTADAGYEITAATVNGAALKSPWTVTGPVQVVSRAALKSYQLRIQSDSHVTVTVTRGGSVLTDGAEIKHFDSLSVSARPSAGYKVRAFTLNGQAVSESFSHQVGGAVTLIATAAALGFVYLDTGSEIRKYALYLDTGTGFKRCRAYVDTGSKLCPC